MSKIYDDCRDIDLYSRHSPFDLDAEEYEGQEKDDEDLQNNRLGLRRPPVPAKLEFPGGTFVRTDFFDPVKYISFN